MVCSLLGWTLDSSPLTRVLGLLAHCALCPHLLRASSKQGPLDGEMIETQVCHLGITWP